MDCLYYYVCLLDNCLQKSKTLLDAFEECYKAKRNEGYLAIVHGTAQELCDDHFNKSEDEWLADYSSNDEDDDSSNEESLGDALIEFWDQRKLKLTHDFSIVAWMVSPIPVVYNDAKKNQDEIIHREPTEQLFRKMFYHEAKDEDEFAKMCDLFWSEYEGFLGKSGVYGGHQPYMWNSTDALNGNSFLWHKKYSVPYTRYLGRFACCVCSKILGIGSAERNWGEVKHLKTNKRSHLSAERTKKQATIFGSDCAECVWLLWNAKRVMAIWKMNQNSTFGMIKILMKS